MSQNLHQKATEILYEVLELPEKEALQKIKELSSGDADLEAAVLELYQNIYADSTSSSDKPDSKLVSSIGQKKYTTVIKSIWRAPVFKNIYFRIGLAVVFFGVLLSLGLSLRSGYKTQLMASEQEKLEALLATQSEAVFQWIYRESRVNNAFAKSPEIIQLTKELDELVSTDFNFDKIKALDKNDDLPQRISEIRERMGLESISIVHKHDPIVMLFTEEAKDGESNVYPYIEMNGVSFDYLREVKKRGNNTSHFVPLPDSEIFNTFPENLNRGTYISFATPIMDGNETIGYFFTHYNVAKDLSNIVSNANHGNSVKVYAFSWDNKLLTKARFEKELQQSFVLGFDSTKSSIQSFTLNDPGGPVFGKKQPEIPFKDQGEVDLMYDYADRYYNRSENYGALMEPYRDYRGVEVVGAWHWYKEVSFGMAAEEDVADAYASLKYVDGALIGFYSILTLLLLALFNLNTKFVRFGKRFEDLQQLGQYKVLKKIGEGGFGEVFLAEHNFLKTPVAIKQLKKEFVGTDLLDRFEKEVKITSALSHPNTIRVYDYGSNSNGQFYYVMEYLNGVTLDKVCNSYAKFPVNKALHVLLGVCYSLREAHLKGAVHRDIKPMNIMLCNQGGSYDLVKVLDFGLVKRLDTTETQHTQLNRIGGSPMFMAPERLRDPYHADQRVDIYSVGAVGLFILSGKFLMEMISSKMMTGQQTIEGDLDKLVSDRSDVPQKLDQVLTSCIHFDPEKRPSSIDELIEAFEELQLEHPYTYKEAKAWWKNYDVQA